MDPEPDACKTLAARTSRSIVKRLLPPLPLLLLPALLVLHAGRTGRAEPDEIRFHVSVDGDDDAAGDAGHPFRTLERARRALRLRGTRVGLPEGGATVLLAGGRYARAGTFLLDARDGGRVDAPVRYVAAPEAEVVLHGGVDLSPGAFAAVSEDAILSRLASDDARKEVRVVDLAALGLDELAPITSRGFGQPIRPAPAEVFVGGAPLTLARWPNEGYARTGKVLDPGSRPRDGDTSNRPPRFLCEETRPARWKDAQDVWLYGYWFHDWADQSLPLAAWNPETGEIRLGAPHRYGVAEGKPWFAENLLEELDRPGEYTIDRDAKRLYLWPPAGGAGERTVLSRLGDPLIRLEGASHVVFRGLTFETTRGDAIVVENGRAVRIEACTIRNTGARGVVVRGGTGHEVAGCRIHGTGEGAVHLEGGDRSRLLPSGHVVRDCDISDFSRRTSTYRPAVRLAGCGHRVVFNHLHHAPHAAVIFTGNDHLIANNEIDHVLTRTGDGGAVYCGRDWTLGGTVIRHNHLHDLQGIGKWENAIYLDDQASGIEVIGNRIERCHLGLLIGGGRRNRIEGNLVVDCKVALRFGARGLGWAARMRPTLEKRLAAVPYREEPWRSRFPWLSTLLEDEPMAPRHNVLRGNVLVRSGRTDAHLSEHVAKHGTVEGNLHLDRLPDRDAPADAPELPPDFDPVRPGDAGPRRP